MRARKTISVDSFYDSISGFYDKMIDFEKNLELRKNSYKNIFPLKGRVADLGCGIGLDSIALSLNGLDVTAFDISPKMIAAAEQNAKRYNVNISTHVHSVQTIPKSFNKKFNYVVTVGNTIAHLNSLDLKSVVRKMNDLLLPGGKIFLHILNYELIKKQNKRISNITNREGKIIIRFYDFRNGDLDFNILSFPQNIPKEFQLVTTKHYPHTKKVIVSYLKIAGFKKIKFMGDFQGIAYNVNTSKDLFMEAEK